MSKMTYGYKAGREQQGGMVETDPSAAAVVVRVYERYLAGLSPRGVAGTLNAEGVRPPERGSGSEASPC